jgi:hypothetical protein
MMAPRHYPNGVWSTVPVSVAVMIAIRDGALERKPEAAKPRQAGACCHSSRQQASARQDESKDRQARP